MTDFQKVYRSAENNILLLVETGPVNVFLGREGQEKGRDEQKPKCIVKSDYLLPPMTLRSSETELQS